MRSMCRAPTPWRRRRARPFRPERCLEWRLVRATQDASPPEPEERFARVQPPRRHTEVPECRPPKTRSLWNYLSCSLRGPLPRGLLTPGREPTRYDVLTVKGTSRTSVLFAILSVTLISSRYCPSGNDASGTACPLCN